MFHAKCLLPRLDELLLLRSCLQNFYQCICGRVARGGRSLLSTQPPVMVLRKNAYQYVNVVLGFVGMGQKFGLKVSQNDLKYACLHPK